MGGSGTDLTNVMEDHYSSPGMAIRVSYTVVVNAAYGHVKRLIPHYILNNIKIFRYRIW